LQGTEVGGVKREFGVEMGAKVEVTLGVSLGKEVEGSGACFVLEHDGKLIDLLLAIVCHSDCLN
jgi:hypothetical protein